MNLWFIRHRFGFSRGHTHGHDGGHDRIDAIVRPAFVRLGGPVGVALQRDVVERPRQQRIPAVL